MKNMLFEFERNMWECAKNGDSVGFSALVAGDAVMVCGGYRCTGEEYSQLIKDFGISTFEIMGFEVVCQTEKAVQVHYVVKTSADKPENKDLAGIFHITSTWEKINGNWILVFNMDSRIE